MFRGIFAAPLADYPGLAINLLESVYLDQKRKGFAQHSVTTSRPRHWVKGSGQ